MKPDCDDTVGATKPSVLARVLCFIAAISLSLVSVLITLFMLLANMNIHFSSSPQLGMFLAGWSFVVAAFVATYRLLRRPSFESLWFLVPPALCFAIIHWLSGFPANKHLLH